jgi:hypothetical protein
MRQRQPSFSRKVAGALIELSLFIILLASANVIGKLVIPDPFPVQSGHMYTGEQAEKLIETTERRDWVVWPVVIVEYLVVSLWKNRGPYYRDHHVLRA